MPMTTDADDQINRASVLTGREPDGWQPTSVDAGLAALDVIARFCVNSCLPVTEGCTEADCVVWTLERAAVDYLEQRRLAALGIVRPMPGC